jgi:heterodisulfide reductase subunit A
VAKHSVLIIGGGISGITTALELANFGISAILVEKEARLGGLASSFCCKASDSCNKCFACVVDKRIKDVEKRREITILTETQLVDFRGSEGSYQATLSSEGKIRKLDASALVIAAGIDPYEAANKGEYGYGQFKNVLTARDLEAMLRTSGAVVRPSDNGIPKKIAFFQCVGSRDKSVGNLYCSQVCCAYALRLMKSIHHKYPEIKFAFYYMDIQPAGVHFADFLRTCREDESIRFIRSIPSKVHLVSKTESLNVKFADRDKGEVSEEIFDMIVLSVGMTLKKETKDLADRLKMGLSEDGFLIQNETERGLFFTGACTGPKDIDRSVTQAKSTAFHVYRYLQGRL